MTENVSRKQIQSDYLQWYRSAMGYVNYFDEEAFLSRINRQREMGVKFDNPYIAVHEAAPIDKQYFLGEWWDKLPQNSKRGYLIHVWLNKAGPSFMYGYDWWFPYFEEIGFITNYAIDKPTKEIELYRGALPNFKRGMSWTPDKKFAELFVSQHKESKVYKATIKPESILGIFYGIAGSYDGKEREAGLEYVVNYKEIGEIELVEAE